MKDLTRDQREKSILEITSIQKTSFLLRRTIPRKLYTLWSDLLTDIALGMADATKESEARRAMRYLMLKAVLVQPVRGGGGRRNRNVNLTERLMFSFWKGKEEEVWQIALEIEGLRRKKKVLREKRIAKKNKNVGNSRKRTKESEIKRRSDRAKALTNDGELSKAFSTMVQRGVPPSTDNIIAQLRRKFPRRRKLVRWPRKDRINELRALIEKISTELKANDHSGGSK